MKAAVYYQTGNPSVLQYEDVADPECRPKGLLIEVKAIGIQGGDTLNRLGGMMASTAAFPYFPMISTPFGCALLNLNNHQF